MKASEDVLSEKMDRMISLLQHLLALELARGGVTQADIGKHLKIAKSSVGAMLQGYGNKEQ